MFSSRDGIFVVAKPCHAKCPYCKCLYLTGVAIIIIHLKNQEFVIGQDEDEVHQCSNCGREVRGGRDLVLTKVFSTVREAEERALEVTTLMLANLEEFNRTVIIGVADNIDLSMLN